VLYGNGLAIYHRGNNIAQFEFNIGILMVFATFLNNILMQPACLAGRRGKVVKPVAAIDVDELCSRAGTVGRVDVAIAVDRMIGTPALRQRASE